MRRRNSGPGSTTGGRSGVLAWPGGRPVPRGRRTRLLVLLPLLLLSPACSRKAEPPAIPEGELENMPRQVILGFNLRATSVKGLLWVLEAKRATSMGVGEPTKLDSMVVRFYDGDSVPRSVLTSRHGTVVEKTNALVARDSVVVTTVQGERLETEVLRWDPKEERIVTDEFFRLTRGRDVMTGVGIDAEPSLEHYKVHSEVRVEVRDEDGSVMEGLDGPGDGQH